MGSKWRHYCALCKKNWIIWKRTLGASLCEIFCPIVLMAVLAIARAIVDKEFIPARSNINQSSMFVPVDYLANYTNATASTASAKTTYAQFLDFSEIDFDRKNPIMTFLPTVCNKRDREDPRPIIAYSGNSNITESIVQNLRDLHRLQRANGGNVLNFTFQRYPSYDAIHDYIAGSEYMRVDNVPGVCFGFTIDEQSASDYKVRLIFFDQKTDNRAQNIPYQKDPSNSEFDVDQDTDSYKLYTQQGYAFLHNWIANKVLQRATNRTTASIAMSYVPVKSDAYVSDDFSQVLSGMLPFFLLLIYILPVYRLISNVVAEKESKARESMKMMGLSDFSYWFSWWTYYFVIVTIISVLNIIILSANVFTNSNKGLVFLFLWIYGLSLFGMCVFLQAFFSRARVAAITGTLVYFGTSFINQAVADDNVNQGGKNLASLLPTVAISLGCKPLGLFETSGIGLTAENAMSLYANYKFGNSLILMTISLILFFWLGIYLDNVLPSAYGLRKPWYFCFQASYWFGPDPSKRTRIHQRNSTINQDLENSEDHALFETKNMKRENFEPPSRDLLNQEQDNKILKIADLKKTYDNGFSAVKGLNIKMYNGQIFALLGHNGAGKTTTISMLTGLVNASSGNCEVFGYDLFNDMNSVRQFMGVCPQHDILFDLLTPEEHLDIFCDFKGVDKKSKKEEIRKMLVDVDLWGGKETEARNLSGGNRRKLSVAIAMIGGSKIVLLDEPTAGMDLSARRKLWNMLKNYKNNRIIILTTHYMDEADILGDRIGIMTGGQLICLGSSLFLKNRFGVGYNLTMVKQHKEANHKVGKYLEQKFGEVKKLSEVSSEITYQIPTALSYKFKDFFQSFDNDLPQLDIRSYGISVTTLEEVFLRVGHGDDTTDNLKVKEEIKNQTELVGDKFDEYSIAEDSEKGVCNIFWTHMGAMFRKRFNLYKRNYKGLIVEIFIPVLLVLIGFGFSKVQFFFSSPDRSLTPYDFPLKQRIQVNQNLVRTSGNDFTPRSLIESLPFYNNAFDAKYRDYSTVNTTGKGERAYLEAFDDTVFTARLEEPNEPFRYGSYFIYEANRANMQFKVATFLNITSQDVSAFYPQFMYEAILKQATNNPNFKFEVVTTAFPVTEKLRQRAAQASGVFVAFVVAIGFALIPAAVISFILNEREKNLKHMQLISGMNLSAYWISNLCFDIVKAIIPSAIVIGLMYAFELNFDYVWILFLLFPIGVIPFTYVTSFLFSGENVAQTSTIFLHFIIAGIGSIVTSILRLISSTQSVGDALMWVFKIVPSYCLTDGVMYQSMKKSLILVRPELNYPDLDVRAMGGDILIMCMHGVFWTIILILIEARAFRWMDKCFACCRGKKIPPRTDLVLDEDVVEEETRVENLGKDALKVRVNKFRKGYERAFKSTFLAVEKTSFGLDYGECFALLGVNGAGKSTTFKSLTGEITPTSGEITINGMDIEREFAQVRKLIGYCPQHDAIFDQMTVEEHLDYYARIKGVKKEIRSDLIEKQIKEMNLEEHRKKLAGALSGGNKRKLSVAMCVIGNPPIILLDEPSAGMDPEARRFMWSVVAKISQHRKKSAVILTTHSMEEAEALSTKMGIMVKGGIFKCFGSSQHIKSKFGTGYELEVKVRKLPPDDLARMIQTFGLTNQEEININYCGDIMKSKMIDEFLIKEIRLGGLGNDLVKEAEEHNGMISVRNFLTWLYVEQCGMKIVEGLVDDFNQVELLEHYNDYYKLRVPRGDKSIGFVFSLIENKKESYNISEYSASQTTLEQIFQTFANIRLDDGENLKFHKKGGKLRQLTTTNLHEDEKHMVRRQRSKGDDY